MNSLQLLSPAKLNLFLLINGQRPDGYHELQTLFQLLDYGDNLTFDISNRADSIRLTTDFTDVPHSDNLIVKAAAQLKDFAIKELDIDPSSLGVDITIDKKLPMGGGLGGGSSNAATTLLALNTLWKLDFSIEQLAKIGLALGADVPVFVQGMSAFAEGVGEELIPVELPQDTFVILKPKCHVSTAEIFSHQRLTRDTPKIKIAPALEGGQTHQLYQSGLFNSALYRNDCTEVALELYPEINELLDYLKQYGPAAMTGTGSCCFCKVSDAELAQDIVRNAPGTFKGFVAKGINRSPTLKGLDEARQLATS